MSQDPCTPQTSEDYESESTSTNPRQSVIQQLRDRIEEYEMDSTYNLDPPPADPPASNPDEPTDLAVDGEDQVTTILQPTIDPGGAEIQASRYLVNNLEGQNFDGEKQFSFIFSTDNVQESLVFTNFNLPFATKKQSITYQKLKEKLISQYAADYENNALSRYYADRINNEPLPIVNLYSYVVNPLGPPVFYADQRSGVVDQSSHAVHSYVPLNSPGYNIDMDTFRYITGKYHAVVTDEVKSIYTKSEIKKGIHFINNSYINDVTKQSEFLFNGYNTNTTDDAPLAKVTRKSDSSDLISPLAGESSFGQLLNELDNTKIENYNEAISQFPGGKIQHYTLTFPNVSSMYNFTEDSKPPEERDSTLHDSSIRYMAYMRSGWSWRNYLNGFCPILSTKYFKIKHYRNHFGSRDNVIFDIGDGEKVFYHPSDRERVVTLFQPTLRGAGSGVDANIVDLADSIFNSQDVTLPYTRERQNYYTSFKPGDSKMSAYSTNFFPVMPFYGKRTLIPDEIFGDFVLVNLYWGDDFVNKLAESYGLVYNESLKTAINRFFTQGASFDDETIHWSRPFSDITDETLFENSEASNTIDKFVLDLLPITSRYTKFATFERKTFKDHVTALPSFSTEYDLQTTNSKLSSYIHMSGEYNFFDAFYEDYITENKDFFSLSGFPAPENSYDRSARQVVLENMPKLLPDPYTYDPKKFDEKTLTAGVSVEELQRSPFVKYNFLNSMSNFKERQIFGASYIKSKEFKDIYLKRKNYPMYTDIEIGQTGKSLFLDLINQIDGSETVLMALADDDSNQKTFPVLLADTLNRNEEDRSTKIQTGQVSYVTVDAWADRLTEMIVNSDSPYLERLQNAFSFVAFKEKMLAYAKTKTRDYQQIIDGELAHSEIIGYRVDKFSLTEPTEATENQFGAQSNFTQRQFVKSYYFAGTNSDDPTKFIDTQVEYGAGYEYELYSICLISGTEYAYLDTSNARATLLFNSKGAVFSPYQEYQVYGSKGHYAEWHNRFNFDVSSGQMHFSVISKPSPVIAEVFVRRMSVAILDKPPVPPDVEVLPFKEVPGRVLFNVNSMTGEFFAKPVLLDSNDYSQFYLSALNQGVDPDSVLSGPQENALVSEPPAEDDLLHFKNDDLCLRFEVFRIKFPPQTLSDFSNKKIATLADGATSSNFVDSLAPNVKYYYTFRSVDVHGHVSMPGNIYEVELKEIGPFRQFLTYDIYKLPDANSSAEKPNISFSKFFQIKPSLLQTQLPDLDDLEHNYQNWKDGGKVLGTTQNSIWGKTMLYRITSRATGKIVEVRVKFNRKHGKVYGDGNVEYDT